MYKKGCRSPLGNRFMSLHLVTTYGSKDWKHDLLALWWKGPCVILTTPTAVKVAGIVPWSTTPERRRHTTLTQRTPSGPPRRTPPTHGKPRSFWGGRRKRGPGRALYKTELVKDSCCSASPTQFWTWACGAMPLSVMDKLPCWVSPLCYGDFNSRKELSSLSPTITFLCSPGVRRSHQWARDIGLHLTCQ